MTLKNIFFVSILLTANTISAQTTYYVDATGGSDQNDGISVNTAWQTIDKINQQTFTAGDTISFKSGEVWNDTIAIRLFISNMSGTVSSPIVYNSYGSGAKPIISSVVPHSHTWTNIGGYIWKADDPPTEHPGRLLINGAEKLRANIQSELDGITYFWRYDDDTHDLYLYSAVDPNSFVIAYSNDFPIIIGYASFITLENLDIQGGWTGIYINTLSKNIHLKNLNIGKYCGDGVVVSTGSSLASEYPENIVIENCNFNSYFNFDYSSAGTYSGSSERGCGDGIRTANINVGEIKACVFINWGHASIGIVENSADVSVHHNYLTSPDICYGGRMGVSTAVHCEIFDNQIVNTSVSTQLNGQFNHYHHNIFSDISNTPLKPNTTGNAIDVQAYTSTEVIDNIYENNVIINTEGPGIIISGNNTQDVHNNIFRNNIIIHAGTSIGGKSIEVEENLYAQTYDNAFQNNLVFNSMVTQTCNFRGELYDIAEFNALNGTDGYVMSSNIAANPMFVDTTNSDFHLLNTSPCIDAGILPLATYDFDGNIIPFAGTLPDIGIFEYQGVVAVNHFSNTKQSAVFPNPTTGIIYVSQNLLNENYQLLSMASDIVLFGKLQTNEIDLSELERGIYFLKIADKNILERIIKE